MSTAPDEVAGAASSSSLVGVESGSAVGMALSTTLAVAFAGRAFLNLGSKTGLSPEQIQNAVVVSHSTRSDSLSTTHPGIPQSVVDQLLEGARTAYAIGIAQIMLLLTIICAISGLIIWFGMNKLNLVVRLPKLFQLQLMK